MATTTMFDNYPQPEGYVPCNKPEVPDIDEIDIIQIGGTADHVFTLNFKFSEMCNTCEVYYKQSLTPILSKRADELLIDDETAPGKTFVTVHLTREDTMKFVSHRETRAQLKLFLKDGNILYGNKNKVKIVAPLDNALRDKQIFSHLEKVKKQEPGKDYLFEVWYDSLDKKFASEFLKKISPVKAGCTSISCGDFYIRNFDWNYNNDAVFVVHSAKGPGKFKFDGVASSIPELTKDFVESGEYHENYKLVPFYLLDGINEHKVACSINVVPSDDRNDKQGTKPDVEIKEKVCAHFFPEFILERFSRAREAMEYIRDYVSVYNINSLLDQHYDIHVMIKDQFNTYVIEFINNRNVVIDMTEWDKPKAMTNFHLEGVEFNDDNTLYTPETQDEHHNAIITNKVDSHGSGIERWNIINRVYDSVETAEDAKELARSLFYTNAYGTRNDDSGVWYSEFAGQYGAYDITVATNKEIYDEYVMPVAKKKFDERSRDVSDTWHTTHSSIYDFKNNKLYICSQEANDYIEFDLEE